MDEVRRHIIRPPYGIKLVAVKSNWILKWFVKSREHIQKQKYGPYFNVSVIKHYRWPYQYLVTNSKKKTYINLLILEDSRLKNW